MRDLASVARQCLENPLAGRGFVLASSESTGSFGNQMVVLEGESLQLRLVRDRGTEYLELSARGRDAWFNVELVAAHVEKLDGTSEAFASVLEAASFVADHLELLDRLFGADEYAETTESLRQLGRQAMHARYGRPM